MQWYIGDTLVNVTGKELELTADRHNDGKMLLCIATNNNKSLNASKVLNILYKPVINIAPSQLLTVNYGDTVSVNCVVVKSNPAKILEYIWSTQGQERVIGRESNLTIIDASLKDNGTFQCSARNSVGTSKLSYVTVIVRLVPPRPQYVKALCCETHADVVWVTSLSGDVEQKSFIQFRESAPHSTFFNTTSGFISTQEKGLYSARVNDLELDNTYIFRVVSLNQYGIVTSREASCMVEENQGQSAPSVAATVGGTVGGLMVLILVVIITVIIILKGRRQHKSEKGNLKTSSGQTKYETQTDDDFEAQQYNVISKDVTANLEPSNEYEEIKSKGIKTYIELEETNPRREEKGSDDLNAYYSNAS
ncbi:B-cell receptor CD22-like [Saccostrea cucullata]|uniref:B-cell receptor CD22-like n=1 Tax=Saccostrea cuccullata TaxID=36930 RepID=UPI002ED0B7AE